MYLANDIIAASRKIEDAVSQTPKDALVQAVYAELLMKNNSMDKAKVATDKAFDFNKETNYILPTILQARYCESQKDYFCALNYWQEILKKHPRSEMAIAGVGRSYFEDGHYSDAKRYLSMALQLRTNYIPVLKLEQDLDRVDVEKEF